MVSQRVSARLYLPFRLERRGVRLYLRSVSKGKAARERDAHIHGEYVCRKVNAPNRDPC